MKNTLRGLLLILAITVPGYTQTPQPRTTATPRPAATVSRLILWTGSAADWGSTRLALKSGAVEANPLIPSRGAGQALMIGLSSGLTDIAAISLEQSGHRKAGAWLRVIVGSIHWTAALSNVRVARHGMRRN